VERKGNAKNLPKKGPGRPFGSKNKIPNSMKELVLIALKKQGGTAWFEKLAVENPVAFAGLVGKCIPTEVMKDSTIRVEVIKDFSDDSGPLLTKGTVIDARPMIEDDDDLKEVLEFIE